MKVTIELEVSNLQDLAGMIAGAADGVLTNVAADQEPGKVETAKEVKTTVKKAEPKTEAKTKPAAKKTEAKVETKAKPEPDTESEEKPVHTKAEIKEMLTQFCMDNDGGAAKVQAEFKAIGVASLSEASVEQLNEVVAKLGL